MTAPSGRCLMCRRPVAFPRDCCVACEYLIKGDVLLRDAYKHRGGTFHGLRFVIHPGPRHGTESCYQRGCRRDECRRAKAECTKRRREGERRRERSAA